MELALPHVVVRIFGPGVGPALVAALGVHPVEVTEARDQHEAHRAAAARPPILVVVTDPPDARLAVTETWNEFPETPILIVGCSAACETSLVTEPTRKGCVTAIRGNLSLPDICWHVMEAVSRAALLPGVVERPLGPIVLEVDDTGTVASGGECIAGLLVNGRHVRTGESLLHLVDPFDREAFSRSLAQPQVGDARFCTLRLVGERGTSHAASVGIRRRAPGRVTLLFQPLISGGPIIGRHINNHDPITGLLTRWAMSRVLEEHERTGAAGAASTLLVLKLEDFSAVSEVIGSRETDIVLVRVASALARIMPYPAVNSRLMGDTFLVFLPESGVDDAIARAGLVTEAVNGIDVPGAAAGFTLRVSVGIASVSGQDHDLAIRLADAAADTALAAGGNRAVVAGPAFTSAQAADFVAQMDSGSWEMWLQPVLPRAKGQATFYEALARFGSGRGNLVSRADFFAAGRGHGLLERFDRMMLQRAVQLLAAHSEARLSVNLSVETLDSDAFPAALLELIEKEPGVGERIILEIPPPCLAESLPNVRSRLEALAAAGIAVALDDFGSGICRLRYLTQFPLAMVKLDALVTGYVDDDPLQREFVRAVTSICRARGITTVAEYTRSPEQLQRLVADGVDLFQGELLGMPIPATQVFAFASASVSAT